MINLSDVPENVSNSKAVLLDARKTLLTFAEKYLAQIENAEKKINEKTNKAYIDRINDQRLFIDSLINFLQETDNTVNMLSLYISNMLEFYEAEISSGGKKLQTEQFWYRQALRNEQGKKRIIKAFSSVLNPEQNKELFKIITE